MLRRLRLGGKIVLAIGVIIVLAMVVAYLSDEFALKQRVARTLEHHELILQLLTDRAMSDVQTGLMLNKPDALQLVVDDLQETQEITGVRVCDAQGTVVASTVAEEVGQPRGRDVDPQGSPVFESEDLFQDDLPIARYTVPIALDLGASGKRALGWIEISRSLVDVEQDRRSTRTWNVTVFTLLALFVSGALYLLVHRLVLRPLRRLMQAMGQVIERNDFSQRVEAAAEDVIGELGQSFNRMVETIHQLIGQLVRSSGGVSDATLSMGGSIRKVSDGSREEAGVISQTADSVQKTATAIQEISERAGALAESAGSGSSAIMELDATIWEVASSVEKLLEFVQNTTAAIGEMTSSSRGVAQQLETLLETTQVADQSIEAMNSSIQLVERNTQESAALSEKVREEAEKGSASVRSTLDAMSLIQDFTRETRDVVHTLGQEIASVDRILTVINDVADHTKLLALNAAIIAAEAGEHGRGFAVVADEIGSLSDRIVSYTDEIAKILDKVQDATHGAVEVIDRGTAKVKESVDVSHQAGEGLRRILDSVKESTIRMAEIAELVHALTTDSRRVVDHINRIGEMVRNVAEATRHQTQVADSLGQKAQDMETIAKQVRVTTQEQSKSSRFVTESIEQITTMIHDINTAIQRDREERETIDQAMANLQEIARRHLDSVAEMDQAVELLERETVALRDQCDRFQGRSH